MGDEEIPQVTTSIPVQVGVAGRKDESGDE